MRTQYSPARCRLTAFLLVFILLAPVMFLVTTGTAEAASGLATGSLFGENTTIIKGIVIIVMALFLEKLTGEQKVDVNPGDPPASSIPDNDGNYNTYPNQKYLSAGEKEVLGFFVNWDTPGVESFPSLQRNHQAIDTVSPFWYTVTSNGDLATKFGGSESEVSQFVRQHGQQLVPLINNDKTNSAMLTDPNIRHRAVENIVALVQKNNYSGVNIDFEFIPAWTKDGFTIFIRELSQKLHARGKQLHISVFPQVDVPQELNGAYDYASLAPYVDKMIIMTYDNHWSTGPAGPVAPIKWVEENIINALRYIPAKKLLLGIANYGYDWPSTGKGQDIAAKKAIELAERKNARVQWNSEAGVPYFYYKDSNGVQHQVWFESSYSLDLKLNLVNKYNLQGIAIWRLGNEEDRFWDIVKDRLNK